MEALDVLHRANITHNDIRPANIYYSSNKNSFLIGSFGSCLHNASLPGRLSLTNHYTSPEAASHNDVDLKQNDVYALGVTLLSAFYNVSHIDINAARNYNKNY
jgi:serine/threonine protein kinase